MRANIAMADAADPQTSSLDYYETHAREYFDRTVCADLSALYDVFLKYVRPCGRILDAGCGSGRDLKAFRSRGFDPAGIDASEALVTLARKFSGVRCFRICLEDVDFNSEFDAVWACASLLHLPKTKMAPVLQRLRRSLVKGGVLFASVQIGEGENVSPDGRFFAYYDPDELSRLLEMSGFSVEKWWISEDALPSRRPIRWINVIARNDP
jgi:SAM-dependent methyltransferase